MRHLSFLILLGIVPALAQAQWAGYGHDPQHTATSTVASQSLSSIHWQTPIDTTSGIASGMGPLFAHYGSPIVTAANTVIVPVKTSASGAFQVEAFRRVSGNPIDTLIYTLASDYTVPSNNGGWFPSYGPVLAIRNRVYYPGAGGGVYYRDSVDSPTGASGQLFFYGKALYTANPSGYNSAVQICTPITTDRYGTIYFGYEANGAPGELTSGIAKITLTGVGSMGALFRPRFGLTDSATNAAGAERGARAQRGSRKLFTLRLPRPAARRGLPRRIKQFDTGQYGDRPPIPDLRSVARSAGRQRAGNP